MKVLGILLAFVLAVTMANSRGAVATTANDEFNEKATEWVEGVVANVQKDGRFQLRGAKSGYAGDYATYHREFFSFPEAERELQRKLLQERYKGRLIYPNTTETPVTFTFTVPEAGNMPVYDEASNYGTTLALWRQLDQPTMYKFSDLKAGDRVVVGYDTSERVHSIYRVNPIIRMSGENNGPPSVHVSDLVDKNGVHIMNKSSNETNPVAPQRPNHPTASSSSSTATETGGYRYPYGYDPTIPPTTSSNNQTWNGNFSTNDARTQPPNSRSPNAPSTFQAGSSVDPHIQPGSGQHINSTDGTPNQSRAGDNQTYPNQFDRPDNPTFNQPNSQDPRYNGVNPNQQYPNGTNQNQPGVQPNGQVQPGDGRIMPNGQIQPNNPPPLNSGQAQPQNNQPPPVTPNSGQPMIRGRSMAQPRP